MDSSTHTARFQGTSLFYEEAGSRHAFDASILISTLLVFVAKGDGSISELETGKMLDMLTSCLGEGNAEAMQQLSSAAMTLANDKDIAFKLREIARGLSEDETERVFGLVLDLAMVDDVLDSGEVQAIKFAGQILGLSQDRIHSALRSLAASRGSSS
jgi:uncharacterized tellurite resistance protein B-like protein